jgi:hypothetical protein
MSQYKVRNWSEYNKSLENRGNISFWVHENAIKKWKAPKVAHFIGAPKAYSDDAILCMMMVKMVFHLPYRQLVGFFTYLFSLMHLDLCIPHFTTIGERAKGLKKSLQELSKKKPKDIVFDSSGFKIYGEGEWKVRQHGKQKRRRWKKFHIGVCPETHEIIIAEVTELEESDCKVAPKLIRRAPRSIKRILGDGAYDTTDCYKAAYEHGAHLLVPPRQGAVMSRGQHPWMKERDQAVAAIIGLGNTEEAAKLWKILMGYHKRSLVETAFSRLKRIFGSQLFSRNPVTQEIELLIKTFSINKMTAMGMPKGVMI